jgi:Tol biopolymer transport system component
LSRPASRVGLTGLVPLLAAAMALLAGCGAGDIPDGGRERISFGRFDPKLGDFRIWTAAPDGSDQRPLVPQVSWVSDWAPDGRRLVFEDLETLRTIAPDGSDAQVVVDSLGWQAIPKWSPTGEWIAFEGSEEKPADPVNASPDFERSVWVVRPDGQDLRRVTDEYDVEPVFSPDGTQLAFNHVVHPGSSWDAVKSMVVAERDGTGRREIVPPTPGLEHGDWSPDGKWIIYDLETLPNVSDQPAGRGAIWAVHPDGTGRHVLVPPTDQWYAFAKPAWSPDGKQILAGCNTPGGVDRLCVIDVATGYTALIVDHSRDRQPVNFPAWGPAAS